MSRRERVSNRVKLVFPLLGHPYQILHSLPIAAALASRPGVAVHVASMSAEHHVLAQKLVAAHVGATSLRFDELHVPAPLRVRWRFSGRNKRYAPGKSLMLLSNRNYFRKFDALITAERTSLLLRRWGLFRQPMIYTTHGAGDREISVTSELSEFDFLLLAGRKHEQRLLELGRIRPGRYATGIYAKLDWMNTAGKARPRLFDNARRTVLYAPHFSRQETSWFAIGREVLEQFAASRQFNLIFAPHVRLFDPPTQEKYRAFREFAGVSHMHIDLGSERCIDMTYTAAADLYLGDVSSQVAEYLVQPRPCVFLNPRRIAWTQDKNYRAWHTGPVIESTADLERHVSDAFDSHRSFVAIQEQYVRDTFGSYPIEARTADRAADAIMSLLEQPECS